MRYSGCTSCGRFIHEADIHGVSPWWCCTWCTNIQRFCWLTLLSSYQWLRLPWSSKCPNHGQCTHSSLPRLMISFEDMVTILLLLTSSHRLTVSSGCRIEYLPPYSPDFNPIEQAFSVIKFTCAEVGSFTFSRTYYEMYCACALITPEKTWGMFAHSVSGVNLQSACILPLPLVCPQNVQLWRKQNNLNFETKLCIESC